ncbi:MAG: hypothetical protein ACI965_000755 [Paraglaciecola sp.]
MSYDLYFNAKGISLLYLKDMRLNQIAVGQNVPLSTLKTQLFCDKVQYRDDWSNKMSIDDKISQALKAESAQVDQLLAQDNKGLFDMLFATWRGGMERWVLLVNVFVLLATVLLFGAGYQFWIAELLERQVFWGVVFLATAQVQISLKMWLFMEMNRMSTIREIKRVEIAIARLSR